jgi:heme-degrading monooxygenase HmoA
MVLEHALFIVDKQRQADFEAAFREARILLSSSPGCLSVSMAHGIEDEERYLLLVEWESIDAHLVGFRGSPAYTKWRELLGPHYRDAPVVEHYNLA